MNKYIAAIQDEFMHKGIAEGIEQGIEKGIKQGSISVYKNMIKSGIINDTNYKEAGLSDEEYVNLKKPESDETNLF